MSLGVLATLGDQARSAYTMLQEHEDLWMWVRGKLRLPADARAPRLTTPTAGDGLTVGKHFDLARDKAQRPVWPGRRAPPARLGRR